MKLKPLSGLTRPLLVLLKIMLVLDLLAIPLGVYNFYEYSHLAPGVNGAEVTLTSDLFVGLAGIAQGLFGLVTGIVFLRWLYRANFNLRRMTSQVMRCTPGWAVGWFFVPFANLVKPYEATQEVWRVANKDGGSSSPVGRWWGLWLLSCLMDNVAGNLVKMAGTTDLFQAAAGAFVLSDLTSVALNLAALKVVNSVAQGYAENYSESILQEQKLGADIGFTPSLDEQAL